MYELLTYLLSILKAERANHPDCVAIKARLCVFVFGFGGKMLDLIIFIPDHYCLSFYLSNYCFSVFDTAQSSGQVK